MKKDMFEFLGIILAEFSRLSQAETEGLRRRWHSHCGRVDQAEDPPRSAAGPPLSAPKRAAPAAIGGTTEPRESVSEKLEIAQRTTLAYKRANRIAQDEGADLTDFNNRDAAEQDWKVQADPRLPIEERARRAWNADAAIRAEFIEFETYLGWRRGVEGERVAREQRERRYEERQARRSFS